MSLLGLRPSQRMWLPPACFWLPVSCLFFPSIHLLSLFHSGLSRLYRRRFCLWLFLNYMPTHPVGLSWVNAAVFSISSLGDFKGYGTEWMPEGGWSRACGCRPLLASCCCLFSWWSPLDLKLAFKYASVSQEPHSQFQYHYPDNNIFKCVRRVIFYFVVVCFAPPTHTLCCHLAAFKRSHSVALTWLYQYRPNYFIFSYAFIRGAGSREICQFLRNKYNGYFCYLNGINDTSGRRVLQTCQIFTSPVGFPEFINCIRMYNPHTTHWT